MFSSMGCLNTADITDVLMVLVRRSVSNSDLTDDAWAAGGPHASHATGRISED